MRSIKIALFFGFILAAQAALALDYAPIVINEFDYDQPEYQKTGQFIELKNTTERIINLKGYTVELYDTTNNTLDNYLSLPIQSEAEVEAGGYFVMCRDLANTSLTSEQCDRFAPNQLVFFRTLERGGIVLKNASEEVVDSMSWGRYEEGLTEGPDPAPQDKSTKSDYSLSRVPDGLDTGENSFDFKWTCASPNRANYTENECKCLQTTCYDNKVCNPETGLCELPIPDESGEDVAGADSGPVEDVIEPDSVVQDVTPDDTLPGDSGSSDVFADSGRPDAGGVSDSSNPDPGLGYDIVAFLDLPGDEDLRGGKGGCSADPRSASGALPGLAIIGLFLALLAVRRRLPS